MSLADLKFVVASVSGLAICCCLALWALLLAYCANSTNTDQALDDFTGGSSWLLATLAVSVSAYVWAQG